MCRLLSGSEAMVIPVTNGYDALLVFGDNPVHAIITRVDMSYPTVASVPPFSGIRR